MRKHKLLISVLLVFIFSNTNAQVNLIIDPSFEDTITCMYSVHGQWDLYHWKNLDSTRPENCQFVYMHYNSWDGWAKLPYNNFFIFQNPHSGFGFIDIALYWTPAWTPQSIRAIARGKLKHQLVAGKKYCAKSYLSPSVAADWYVNGYGMYFDNGQLDTIVAKDSSGIYTFVTPQVQANYVMKDTSEKWNEVRGTFIANGTETFVSLGNFKSDSATQRDSIHPGQVNMACYCAESAVDDVSLIPVDIANWLRDTSVTLTDSVYIGLPKYEVPDAIWYTINGVSIDTASGIWVKPTQAITQYIQAIDVCDKVAYDTVTVYAYPLSNFELGIKNFELKVFPNPATNSINITCVSFLINQEKLQILDITGKELLHFIPDKNEMVIDISRLAKGVYFVKYGSENIQFVKE
ncbi:MAG: hypothetical protein RLZZ118_781 [Bacteroidota bacterium]|jgi:hypothetical protein